MGLGFEEGLEDEDGGDLVDDAFAPQGGVSAGVEMAVGFGGGEALVPELDGEVEFGAEVFGEGLGLGRLRALVAGHMERIPDHDEGDGVLAQDAGDGFEVRASTGAMEREERLRGVAQGVGEGEADAAVAHIEGEDALRGWAGG